jgi:hypothetical protein
MGVTFFGAPMQLAMPSIARLKVIMMSIFFIVIFF